MSAMELQNSFLYESIFLIFLLDIQNDHSHFILGGLLQSPASLPCFVLLVLLVSAAKVYAAKVCTYVH
jgi:hypothetical protein